MTMGIWCLFRAVVTIVVFLLIKKQLDNNASLLLKEMRGRSSAWKEPFLGNGHASIYIETEGMHKESTDNKSD